MNLAVTQRRKKLADTVAKLIAIPYCDEEIQAAGKEWLEGMDDAEASRPLARSCWLPARRPPIPPAI